MTPKQDTNEKKPHLFLFEFYEMIWVISKIKKINSDGKQCSRISEYHGRGGDSAKTEWLKREQEEITLAPEPDEHLWWYIHSIYQVEYWD